MLSQPQMDVNALLHNMRAQILTLTTQLAKLQANPPAATPSVEKKLNKKVEVVVDPGAFEGDRVPFAKWWIKLQIWVKANWDAFADNFEIALESEKPDNRLQTLAGRSYNKIRAFFYDQQAAEMKAQGKEFGA
ncbi:hypothetical protein SERLA73DRAFT_74092 [Serpula lacrymans var. lacrymans S7.3]|uniref:Retrotransposon gag domain-containing protein n=2 Tax=Serpula lacrymans var. lacrymans TaxID=341189 RepID=F8Q0K4_SERL3|nr:uncharacterized protein SERLADRAFT_438730 [Serpula lacrymans var. lacrymans S7.9]EGN97833.1 hypothetical protein SERLA73DRAFT_74092 [Serpula lacrymans var. lacrymans S7.3]EGO23424.1 hypothetical protein SERLADRAFT_438730 [Serpula lacrymans var. lacrymans S7.9]